MRHPRLLIATRPPFAWFLVIFMIFLSGCREEIDHQITVFQNVHVVDPVDGIAENRTVTVRDGTIHSVESAEEAGIPAAARVVDGEGRYLIPGLWDAHIHVTNDAIRDTELLPLYILKGITYLRDTSAILDEIEPVLERARERAGEDGLAPEIYFSGPHIEGEQPSWESSVSASSPEEGRELALMLIEAGVNEIKLYELLPPEIFYEVMEVAGEHDIPVSAHVPLGMDAEEASGAGLASIEHMNNLEYSMSADADSLLEERRRIIAGNSDLTGQELRNLIHGEQGLHTLRTQDSERRAEVLQTLAANGTWLVPTLVVNTHVVHRIYHREDWAHSFRYLPEDTYEQWQAGLPDEPAEPDEYERLYAEWAYGLIPDLVNSGVDIMAGTDAPLFWLTPAFSLHEELGLLVDAGLEPLQALEAATLAPARYFGLEEEQGRIAVGMRADLVLLDENPLDDIRNTRRISSVMRNGFLHTRDDLEALERTLQRR